MKNKVISVILSFCFLIASISPVLASDLVETNLTTHSNNVLPCGHSQVMRFLDSDECVQCFEEHIIQTTSPMTLGSMDNLVSPCGTLCPDCGRSTVAIICAGSNIINYDNYQEGTNYLCTGCFNNTCDSPCYVLQYESYSLYVCNECGYSGYVFNSSGTGLARHYCGVYDYCSGNNYYIYCDIKGDRYDP